MAARGIQKVFPHMKFILSLRDPVDRMYSQFGHQAFKRKPGKFELKDMPFFFDKKANEQLKLWKNITSNDGLKQNGEYINQSILDLMKL